MASALVIACLLCVPGSDPSTAPALDANAAWRELFAQPAPAEANAQLQAVLDAVGQDVSKLKSLIATDSAYEAFRPGWIKRQTQVADGNKTYETEYFLRIPRGYSPRKSWPLLLACHGQSQSGPEIGQTMEMLLGPAVEEYILLAPTMPGPDEYNARAYQEQAYLQPLAWARLRLNVDDDRIYISGYSQGGHHTWHLATMYPRLFAAAVSMAGFPAFEGMPFTRLAYLENLSNLPLWSIWGEKDVAEAPSVGVRDLNREVRDRLSKLGVTTYRGTELPGVGHEHAAPDGQEFRKFLAANKRVLIPRTFSHAFHLWQHRDGYYLTAAALSRTPLDFSGPIQVDMGLRPDRPPTTQEVLEAGQVMLDRSLFRFSSELDPAANQLTVQARNVRILRLTVLDGMFDLSRPVTFRYFGRLWAGPVRPSARAMLVHYAATRDATGLVLNEIDLLAAGIPQVRYRD